MFQKLMNSVLLVMIVFLGIGCSRPMLEGLPVAISSGSTTIVKSLVNVDVTPSNASIEVGDQAQLRLIATYSDGSKEDITDQAQWTAAVPSISTLSTNNNDGSVIGVSRGTSVINASYRGAVSSAMVKVNSSNLTSIEVTPLNQSIILGVGQNFIATGIYADHSKADLTNQVVWSSSNATVASISNAQSSKGHATGLQVGSTTITATFGSVSGNTGLDVLSLSVTSLSLTPINVTVPMNSFVPYIATAVYSDGSSADVSSSVTWTSTASSIASIDANGKAKGLAAGQTFIRASLNGISAQTSLTVSQAVLDSLAITPGNSSGAIGIQERFKLIGTFSDGSTQDLTGVATWNSSNALSLLVSNLNGFKGQALALLAGPVTVSATANGLTASTQFTVSPALLVSIQVTPNALSIPLGVGQQLKAVATFSDASVKDVTNDVTWTLTNPSAASISNAAGTIGKVVANAVGATSAVASLGSVVGTSVLTTTNALLNTISLAPSSSSAPLGNIIQMVATGHYSDGSTLDVTKLVNWSSSTSTILNPSNAQGFQGKIYSLAVGNGLVTASLDGVTQNLALTVTIPELTSITISPNTGSLLGLGLFKQFKATGLYTNGSSTDMTNSVQWTHSNGLGTINLNGLFLALNTGLMNVTATKGAVSKTNAVSIGN